MGLLCEAIIGDGEVEDTAPEVNSDQRDNNVGDWVADVTVISEGLCVLCGRQFFTLPTPDTKFMVRYHLAF